MQVTVLQDFESRLCDEHTNLREKSSDRRGACLLWNAGRSPSEQNARSVWDVA